MSSATIENAVTDGRAATDRELRERFAPVFDRVAQGASAREQARRLPFEEVGWLREARFGAVRVSVEHGGFGASVRQLFGLLMDLAAAESNLPQALRVHWSRMQTSSRICTPTVRCRPG